MLTDYTVTRRNGVNGEKLITAVVNKTARNEHAYDLIQNENIFIYDDEEYVIKTHRERTVGKTVKVECQAVHRMFDDLKNNYIYEQTSGTIRLEPLLEFVLEDTGYTFIVDTSGLPLSIEIENFGDDNSLSLFKKVLERFGAEFEVYGDSI